MLALSLPKRSKRPLDGFSLIRKLRRGTRRALFIQVLRAALLAFAASAGSLYALLFFVFYFPQAIFFTCPPAVLILGAAFPPLAAAVWVFARRCNNTGWMVRMLEQNCPELGDRLLTAVELVHAGKKNRDYLSKIFSVGLNHEVDSDLGRMDWRRVMPLGRLIVPLGAAAAVFIGASVHARIQPDFFGSALQLLSSAPGGGAFSLPLAGKTAGFSLQVTPGSCEVPLNANLGIQAEIQRFRHARGDLTSPSSQAELQRFQHAPADLKFPEKIELYVRSEGSPSWAVYPMMEKEPLRFETLLTSIRKNATYFVKAGDVRSSQYQIRLSQKLGAETIGWEIYPPAYTGTPLQRKQGWFEKLTMPEGSRVKLRFKFNRAVQPGWLLEKGRRAVPLAPAGETELEGEFETLHNRILSLSVHDTQGEALSGLDPVWIQSVPDLPPYIEVLEPQMQNYVFATEEVPFDIAVNDDYGIQALTLVLQYKGKTQRLEWLPPAHGGKRDLALRPLLELEKLPLASRDLVFSYVEVRDNYPGEPAQIARSPLMTFMVRDYVEQYKVRLPASDLPSLRSLFEDIVHEQTEITREVWDYLSLFETEKSFNENEMTAEAAL